MIFVTGDTHSKVERLNTESFPEQKEMTKDDYVVILGDFGLVWDFRGENKTEKHWLDWLEEKSFTTLFIDGNHDNHKRLAEYPVEEWHGGKVHKIRPSVIHLMRGEVYDIDGARCLAFGGAPSHDIRGLASDEEMKENYAAGILDRNDPLFESKLKRLKHLNHYAYFYPFRVLNESWWKEEIASEEEYNNALNNLAKVNNKVDFVFSHDAPSSTVALLSMGEYKTNQQTRYLENIREQIDYKAWLFGHYHEDKRITEKEFCLYWQIVRIH